MCKAASQTLQWSKQVWNGTLETEYFPDSVVRLDIEYEHFNKMIQDFSQRRLHLRGCGNSGVRCILVDDAGIVVLHPAVTTHGGGVNYKEGDGIFLSKLEPRLTEALTRYGIIEDFTSIPQVDHVKLMRYATKKVRFDRLPTSGSFTGAQRGNYQVLQVPNTNLALIHITEYEIKTHNDYCGFLSPVCPQVREPHADTVSNADCDPLHKFYSSTSGSTLGTKSIDPSCTTITAKGKQNSVSDCKNINLCVPTVDMPLTAEQLSYIMSSYNHADCSEEGTKTWVYVLIALAVILVCGAFIGPIVWTLSKPVEFKDDDDVNAVNDPDELPEAGLHMTNPRSTPSGITVHMDTEDSKGVPPNAPPGKTKA